MLADGLPNAGCGEDARGSCGSCGRVVDVVGGATGCMNVVVGGGGCSVVGGVGTCLGGSVDDGTVVEGADVVGGVVPTGCARSCTA